MRSRMDTTPACMTVPTCRVLKSHRRSEGRDGIPVELVKV
jgi:hypothetical protein